MRILGEPPAWNKSAAELLRQFLATKTGQIFLATLSANRPSLSSPAQTLDAVALRAKEAEGYEKCLTQILRMSEPTEDGPAIPEYTEAYPDLDDDSKWRKEGEEKTKTA